MKVVVTGGAGFIGSHLCDSLLEQKHEVLIVDNFLTGSQKNIEHLLKNPQVSVLDHDVTMPLPPNIAAQAVFHLASPASPNHHSKISYHALPLPTMLINTAGTLELLKFCKAQGAKFLFASSSEVYGDPLEHPQKETYFGNVSTTGPRSVYDEAKRFGETITAHFWRRENVDARIARIFNTYGPRMRSDDLRMVVTFINQALAGKDITVFGDGSQSRSLCYVDDTVEGLMRLMFKTGTKAQVVNIGSPEEHTVLEYAELIKRLTGSSSKIDFSEELPENDPLKRRPDIGVAKKLLGWEPKVSLDQGLQKMISYIKSLPRK